LFSIPTGVGGRKRFFALSTEVLSAYFVDVLLFSFQGSFVGHSRDSNFYNITCPEFKVNTISKYFSSLPKDKY